MKSPRNVENITLPGMPVSEKKSCSGLADSCALPV